MSPPPPVLCCQTASQHRGRHGPTANPGGALPCTRGGHLTACLPLQPTATGGETVPNLNVTAAHHDTMTRPAWPKAAQLSRWTRWAGNGLHTGLEPSSATHPPPWHAPVAGRPRARSSGCSHPCGGGWVKHRREWGNSTPSSYDVYAERLNERVVVQRSRTVTSPHYTGGSLCEAAGQREPSDRGPWRRGWNPFKAGQRESPPLFAAVPDKRARRPAAD